MCGVHLSEPEESMLKCPHSWLAFLNPMSCDRKITICVRCLPCVAGQTNLSGNKLALQAHESNLSSNRYQSTHVEAVSQCLHLLLELGHNCTPRLLSTWNLDTSCSLCSYFNHILEWRMFECLYGLTILVRKWNRLKKNMAHLVCLDKPLDSRFPEQSITISFWLRLLRWVFLRGCWEMAVHCWLLKSHLLFRNTAGLWVFW